MALPELKVEVAFGFGPYDPEPLAFDWIDITDHAFEVTTSRGRTSEFDQFPAGTATIGLFNDDRTFDPLNTAGPHYGQLVANVPIRVRATIGVTTYNVFRGFVDGWPATYSEAGTRAEIQIGATDAFKILAERPFPDTWLSFLEGFGTAPPTGYYAFDTAGPEGLLNTARSGSSGRVGQTGYVTTTINTTEPLSPVSAKALDIPGQTAPNALFYWGAQMLITNEPRDNPIATTAWSISFLMRASGRGFQGLVDVLDTTFQPNPLLLVQADISGGLNYPLFAINGGGAYLTATGDTDIGDGAIHHIVLVRNANSATLYVDGHVSASDVEGAASSAPSALGGRVILGRSPLGPTAGSGTVIDELLWWPHVLSASQVEELYTELTEGFGEIQTSGAAITAILDEIGWPGTLRAIDAGEILVRLPPRPAGTSTLELLQNVAACEGGRLFVDAAGKVTFHGRSRFTSAAVETAVQYAFTDTDRDLPTPPDVGLRDGTLSITIDDRLTFDAAEITRTGGVAQAARNTTTPTRTYKATGLYLSDDRQALSLAQWVTFRYGTPQPRSETWEADGETRPADWPDLLTLEIGHRIRHDITPGGVGSAIELEQHLAVIGHTITPEQWIVTLNGSPTDPNEGAYFLWATSETADPDNGWGDTDGTPPGGYWG